MTRYSDEEFKLTKSIKQGKIAMNIEFEPLANWIYDEYGTKPLNIIYKRGLKHATRPCLDIIFEREVNFYYKDIIFIHNEIVTDAILKKFKETLINQGLYRKINFLNWLPGFKSKYNLDDIYIWFSDFKFVAQTEANENVSQSEIERISSEVDAGLIWSTTKFGSGITFFLYTEKQVAENTSNGLKAVLSQKYFEVLKKYDEFNYFDAESFSVGFDSKENLDKNYNGSFYDYYH
jgi:hypothetical protein